MIANGFIALFSAMLTSLLTAIALYALYQRRLRAALEKQLEEIENEFERRVREGALAAGRELLPEFREQVRLGFEDALKGTKTGEMVESAAGVVNAGKGLFTGSLSALLGIKRK